MRSRKLYMLLLCVLAGAGVSAQDANTLIKQVRDKLLKVQDYKAQAVLKIDVPFIRIPQSDVEVYYKRPDKFRIKKKDGVSITPKGGVNINLNSLLSGNQFTAVAAGETKLGAATVKVVKLLPLEENSEVVLTTLYIDNNALIRKATSTTRDNGTYEMEMEYGKFANWGLPDKVIFIFNTKEYKLPKGMTLEYEGGSKPATPSQNGNKEQKGKIEVKYASYAINKGVDDKVFK